MAEPSFGYLSRRTRDVFDIDAVDADHLDPRMLTSIETFIWFRDLDGAVEAAEGWHFLSAASWLEFSPAQADALEATLVSTSERLVRVPPGHNILEAAWVDLDRMLILDPALPDFAATAHALPPGLPVARRATPRSEWTRWWYTRSLDDDDDDWRCFDDADAELLSLACQADRPCAVLYGSARAIVVEFNTMQWSDCLWACGFDDEDAAFEGRVKRDDDAAAIAPLDSDEDESEDDTGQVVARDNPRFFQAQLEELVAMGFDWHQARAALGRASTLEEATSILLQTH